MPAFTLQPRQWYALEMVFPSGERHVSPVYCYAAQPKKTGNARLDFEFFHANYPEGVNHKIYELRIFHRGPSFVLATRTDDQSHSAVLLTALDESWMQLHFAWFVQDRSPTTSLFDWLHRKYPNLDTH
jgi:hypothetical protein